MKLTVKIFFVLTLALGVISPPLQAGSSAPKQPNFVWILTEDSSKDYFRIYNKQGAHTPNIEALAQNGVVFDHAFSNAPVCSVARSTLATGAYAPRIGTQYHRAWDYAVLPDDLTPISKMLMNAGYYASNNFKTDYNFEGTLGFWNDSGKTASWQKRKKGQPFFHMQTIENTHSSSLHYPEEYVDTKKTQHNPENIVVAPIYPDTKVFRYTYARYLDKIQAADARVGLIVKQLEDEGLLENTFIFFMGDHGGPLPGSKGYLFERGLNPPLIVRIPENYKHLLHKDMRNLKNARIDGFVNFVDFAPTLATLANLPASNQHDGHAFMGNKVSLATLNKRQTSFSSADRFDERSSLLRSLRHKKFKYIRHYESFTPDSLFNFYRFKQPAYKQWAKLNAAGKLNDVQASYFKPKHTEALYDLETDPFEINNLAANPAYKKTLLHLRAKLTHKLKTLPDVGFIPESELLSISNGHITRAGQTHKSSISTLIDIANMQLQPFTKVQKKLANILENGSDWEKYWALIVATSFGDQATSLLTTAQKLSEPKNHVLVRSRALQFLATTSDFAPQDALIALINDTKEDLQVVEILNIAAQLKNAKGFTLNIPRRASWVRTKRNEPDAFRKNSKFGMINQRLLFLRGDYDS